MSGQDRDDFQGNVHEWVEEHQRKLSQAYSQARWNLEQAAEAHKKVRKAKILYSQVNWCMLGIGSRHGTYFHH